MGYFGIRLPTKVDLQLNKETKPSLLNIITKTILNRNNLPAVTLFQIFLSNSYNSGTKSHFNKGVTTQLIVL